MNKDNAVNQSSDPRPALTGTAHTLPFDKLSPRDFERLCLWLVEAEGYERAEHWGAAGSEQGRDVVAWRGGELWAFQCKRVQHFGPSNALEEVDKVLSLPKERHPVGMVFLVTCDVSANTRQQARDRCAEAGLACDFWTGTELDHLVKRHGDIKTEFFAAGRLSADPTKLEAAYLRKVQLACNALPLALIDPRAVQRTRQRTMELLTVYVALDTRTQVVEREEEGKAKAPRRRASKSDAEEVPDWLAEPRPGDETRFLSALEAVNGERQMVLLGDPGGGVRPASCWYECLPQAVTVASP